MLVLTAAHCLIDTSTNHWNPIASFQIITGRTVWDDPSSGQVSGATQGLVYPSYGGLGFGDVGLLVLSSPTTAPAMPLADASVETSLTAGQVGDIAGWGETDSASSILPETLQGSALVIQSSGYCTSVFGADGIPFYPSNDICAIDPNYATGFCHGDSGGPMVVQVGMTWTEIGIIDYTDANCDTTVPDGFIRADLIEPWVQQEIAAYPPPVTTTTTSTATTITPAIPAPKPITPPAPVKPTPTPAATTTTTATTAAPPPPPPPPASPPNTPGVYRGKTRQHKTVTLRVVGDGEYIVNVTTPAHLTCAHTYSVDETYTWFSYAQPEPVNANHTINDTWSISPDQYFRPGRLHLEIRFTSPGKLIGYLSMSLPARSHRVGTCRASGVPFSATLQ